MVAILYLEILISKLESGTPKLLCSKIVENSVESLMNLEYWLLLGASWPTVQAFHILPVPSISTASLIFP